jgi:hypothetical protein
MIESDDYATAFGVYEEAVKPGQAHHASTEGEGD